MDLNELLITRRDAILDDASAVLDRSALTHYDSEDAHTRREWLSALYDRAAQALTDRDISAVQAHAESVAHERFVSGFDLSEVQTAFNSLEEALWRALVAGVPADELVEDLGLIGIVLGRAKDRLAAEYVRLATQHHAPCLDVDALFDGMVSGA